MRGNGTQTCGALSEFDSLRLPYLWVPGLPLHRLPNEAYHAAVNNDELIEVTHRRDTNQASARFVWLYAAPGSGVWWNPGRTIVAENVLMLVLRWHTPFELAEHLAAKEKSGRHHWVHGSKRRKCPRCSWRQVLKADPARPLTCCGEMSPPNASNGAAGRLRASLALAADAYESLITPPLGLDSAVLIEQKQRWLGRSYAMPEIIDFRRDRKHDLQQNVFRGKLGRVPCTAGPMGASCMSCWPRMHALCSCAQRIEPRPRTTSRGGTTFASKLQDCCEQSLPVYSTSARRMGRVEAPSREGSRW
jgi:hypothetical protein